MSIRLAPGQKRRTSNDDDDEPLDHLTAEANTLSEAREMITALRAELKSTPAATRPESDIEQFKVPATKPIASQANAPTTPGRPKPGFADLSTPDLLAKLKAARAVGDNADEVRRLLAEVEARGADRSSSNQTPAKPRLTLPAEANTPALIRAVFDNTSMEGLRQMLQTEGNSPRKMTIFWEIKRREKEGLK